MHLISFPKHAQRPFTRFTTKPRNFAAAPSAIISVDVGRLLSTQDANAQQNLHRAADELHALSSELGLSVTWGISEPFLSPLVDRICSASGAASSHEIAFRLDPRLSSSCSRRKLLADGLMRCMRQAESAGQHVTSLFAAPSLLAGNHDLLVRRGITSVRHLPGSQPSGNRTPGMPRQVRYGLWEYPTTYTLPHERPLTPRRTGSLLAPRSRVYGNWSPGVLHVAIEASRLAGGDRWAWRTVEKSLRMLTRAQMNGVLRVEPMGAVTARLASVPAAAPQRSILRAAA